VSTADPWLSVTQARLWFIGLFSNLVLFIPQVQLALELIAEDPSRFAWSVPLPCFLFLAGVLPLAARWFVSGFAGSEARGPAW
jgi:hypothetical protein